jgi:hypothetical protein
MARGSGTESRARGRRRKTAARTPPSQIKPQKTEFLDPRLSKALAHWLRVNILAVARWREISPSEYARESGESLNRVAYHFRRLAHYSVIELTRTEQVRGSTKHFYKGTRQAIFAGEGWELLPKSVQDGVAGAALQDYTKVAVRALETGTFSSRDDSFLTWDSATYDELAFKAMVKILATTRERLLALAEEAAPRLVRTGQDGVQVAFALSGFEMAGL